MVTLWRSDEESRFRFCLQELKQYGDGDGDRSSVTQCCALALDYPGDGGSMKIGAEHDGGESLLYYPERERRRVFLAEKRDEVVVLEEVEEVWEGNDCEEENDWGNTGFYREFYFAFWIVQCRFQFFACSSAF